MTVLYNKLNIIFENDTLVLAGCETVIPVSVTKILDWAWGERAVNNLYIPNTVIEIASKILGRNQTQATEGENDVSDVVSVQSLIDYCRSMKMSYSLST